MKDLTCRYNFCKKRKNNFWTLKQYPRVNGGIVALDLILEMSKLWLADLILNQVNLTE